ncbi:efflux transporter outer membrane subunit [Citrifermentans bremense]|uniref:efflux transporter outer membrane subunit n=1 Tax=Citrifermentans bremense TaxID=60035 RepID=UPI0004037212|nr:efflux transporter outer membrane subunit [Citrifermentans bremense]
MCRKSGATGREAVTARRGRIFAAALCLLLAGCAVSADYRPPRPDLPPRWSTGEEAGAPLVTAETPWWSAFGDPLLNALIDRALRANPDVRLAEARVLEARARRGAATGSLAPSFDARGSFTRERESRNAPNPVLVRPGGEVEPPGTENLFQAGFDASWELDLFGGKRRAVEAVQADLESALYERGGVVLTLIAEVSRNYFELRGIQRQSRIATTSVAVQRESLALLRARFAAGMATDLDVVRAEAEVERRASLLPSLDLSYRKALHRLGVLLGEAPGAFAGELQPESIIPVPSGMPPVGAPSDILRQRPDLRRAERQLAAASARVGVAKADLYPRFVVSGSLALASEEFGDFFDRGSVLWSIGPSIIWPIFQRGRIVARIEVRDAQEQQALIAYRRVILDALEDMENALAGYRDEADRRAALIKAVDADRLSVVFARGRYQGGLTDFREVLVAERNLLQAQGELAQSETNLLLALVALYKALGGGWSVPDGEGE